MDIAKRSSPEGKKTEHISSRYQLSEELILQEKLRATFRATYIGHWGYLVLILGIIHFFHPYISTESLVMWGLVCIVYATLSFFIFIRKYHKGKIERIAVKSIARKLTFHNYILGTLWSVFPLLVYNSTLGDFNFMVFIFVIAPVVGCIGVLGTYPPPYYGWSLPPLITMTVYFISQNDLNSYILISFGWIVFILITAFVYHIHRIIDANIRSNYMSRKLASDLEEEKLRTESASQAKTNFLTVMSHEVRTPLTGIMGAAELLEDRNLSVEEQKYIATIKDAGETLLSVTDEVLNISRIESGTIIIKNENFNLGLLIENILQTVKPVITAKGLNFNHELANFDYIVVGDKQRLNQVLLNLLNNAIKFTDEGHITLRVVPLIPSDTYSFEIIDTGIGIAKGKHKEIFKAFYQVDQSRTRRHEGAGIGLALCEQLIKKMRGELGVESEVGIGSRFWFNLTLPKSYDYESAAQKYIDGDKYLDEKKKLKILLVEDNIANQEILQGLINKENCETTCCDNAYEAMDRLNLSVYDAVFTDIHLPEKDGLELLREIRSSNHDYLKTIPVIAVTASVMSDAVTEYLNKGMSNVLAKPININQLRDILSGLRGEAEKQDKRHLSRSYDYSVMFDKSVLDGWHESLPNFSITHFVNRTLSMLKQQESLLKQSIIALDYEQTKIIAHKLAGMNAQMGLFKAQSQANRIEMINETVPKDEVSMLYDEYIVAATSGIKKLEKWIQTINE